MLDRPDPARPDPALADPARAVLGVERSLLARPWRHRLDAAGAREAMAMVQGHGLPDALARVLGARGVRAGGAAAHLEPRLKDLLPDPMTFTGMAAAVPRLARAVDRGERVAVFGDYDVDGAASAALLAGYLRAHGLSVEVHIPDRIAEGYGPNAPAIRRLRAAGAGLLVAVDCGTHGHEPFAEATRLGLDVVVLDHHQAGADLPVVEALVNPNRQDCLSGAGHLCAAGVVFVALVALAAHLRARGREGPDLMAALDLVALATVADVVPLVGVNRAFVRQGLRVMARRGRPGLAALLDAAGVSEPPGAFHLGFALGPRINAGGRIGEAGLGARLLLTDCPEEAGAIAARLDALNRERRGVEAAALLEAEAMAAEQAEAGAGVIAVGAPGWHPGVVGLIAARLKERFARPAFAFALGEGGAVGSGRSVPGVDLGAAVRAAVAGGAAAKGGGHAMAAGASLPAGGLPAFRAFLEAAAGAAATAARAADALGVDALVGAGAASPALVADLERAGPFGQGNAEPVVALPAHRVVEAARVGENHLRLRLRGGDGAALGGVAFRAADGPLGLALLAGRGRPFHLAGTLRVDRWKGRERVELHLLDAAPAGP